MKCYLAIFDIGKHKSWNVMYKNFIIEKKTNREIKGVFLQDLWFTHELNLSDKKCCNDIHFMLLISKYDKDKIELDLNRFESGHPYTNEKPSKTCVKYYNFVLKKNEINEYYNLLHNDKSSNNIKNITLTDIKYKNTTLLLDICNVENKMYLMLPKFTIIKQQH